MSALSPYHTNGRSYGAFGKNICDLPTEILCEIFDFCLTEYRPCNSFHFPKEEPFREQLSRQLVAIGGVCRRWQQAALNHPALWCCLSGSYDNTQSMKLMIKRLKRFIRHSGKLPLCLYIRDWKPEGDDWPKTVPEADFGQTLLLASFLHSYADRWHYIQLNLPLTFSDGPFCGITFPSLTTLSFSTDANPASIFNTPSNRFPTLQRLNIPPVFDIMKVVEVCWEQLTVLEVGSRFTHELLAVLQLLPKLVHFRVRYGIGNTELGYHDPFPDFPIHLPFLETFDIIQASGSLPKSLPEQDAEDLFGYVEAPNLKRLRCSAASESDQLDDEAWIPSSKTLRSFVERSNCQGSLEVVVILAASFFSEIKLGVDMEPVPSRAFVDEIRQAMPKTRIVYDIIPSMHEEESRLLPSLWEDRDKQCQICLREVKGFNHRCPPNLTSYLPLLSTEGDDSSCTPW